MTALVGSGGDANGLYHLGAHRVASDGVSYEAATTSFRVELDGSRTRIADPPVELGLGPWSVGVATSAGLFVLLQDCAPGGDASSGGFGCLGGAGRQRLLRYDATGDRWMDIEVAPEVSRAASPLTLIPGQVIEGGPILFGLPSPRHLGVAHQIAAFDTSTGEWSMILDEPEDLPGTCTDGASVFHLDGRQLIDTFAHHRAQPPDTDTVTLSLDLHVRPVRAANETVEALTLEYPVQAGFDTTDVFEIQPWCMAGGAVLITTSLSSARADLPWALRLPDGSWHQVGPDPAFTVPQPPWQALALTDHVVFITEETSSTDEVRIGRSFDLATRSWRTLPDLVGTPIPHLPLRAGPAHVAVVRVSPEPDEGLTILEIDT